MKVNKKVKAHLLDVCPLDGAVLAFGAVGLTWLLSPILAVVVLSVFVAVVAKRWNEATLVLRAKVAKWAIPTMDGAC